VSTSLPEWNIGVGGKRGFVRREVKLLYTRRDDGGDSEEGEEAADARTRAGTEGGVDEVAAGLEHRHRALDLIRVGSRVLLPSKVLQPFVREPGV